MYPLSPNPTTTNDRGTVIPDSSTPGDDMDPISFQRKWIGVDLKERSASQEHFLDLCRVLDVPTPADDPIPTAPCASTGSTLQAPPRPS
jgi:hypothetical protein